MQVGDQIWAAARRAARWHVHSQETARRNAMVATTVLTQRRRERIEVEAFLDRHQQQYDAHARRLARGAEAQSPVVLREAAG